MAKSASAQIRVTGYGDGVSAAHTLNISTSALAVQDLALSSGDNALSIPAGAAWLLITEDAGLTLRVKGAGGDTGKRIGEKSLIPWDSGDILNASGAGTVQVIWF